MYNNLSNEYIGSQTNEILILQDTAPIDDCNGSTIRSRSRFTREGHDPGIHFERHSSYLPTRVTIALRCIVDNSACSRSLATALYRINATGAHWKTRTAGLSVIKDAGRASRRSTNKFLPTIRESLGACRLPLDPPYR